MTRSLKSILLSLLAPMLGFANVGIEVADNSFPDSFDLGSAAIAYDASDALVVGRAAEMLAADIKAVSDIDVRVNPRKLPRNAVLVGTIGQSAIIDRLVKKGKLDISPIKNGWEQYVIKEVKNPLKGVDRALVIAGCDRRGTAYGVLALSEAIGVNPWYWWADVPVKRHDALHVKADVTSKSPSVKYRGIFINDEDWGLKPWASYNYEKELGDIGPRTYGRVCELLLRLRGNMLAPAMHSCTDAFYSHPESKLVADTFAIIITTSHCEPLLLNNASKKDWDSQIDGPWDYGRNPHGIRNRWEKRLGEASRFENIYTMAMRGLHDEGLRGNYTMEEKVPMIEGVIRDQREMLERHTRLNAAEVPQIFVPYKETMDLYENGLQVPDDITLVWVDDNYGYMKRVSTPAEQLRKGGAGVYYHTSYLGAPHDYLWLNTTPPTLMYAELKKAYDTGADRYWLLNVGDIKPCELGITTFLDMAWDMDSFNFGNVNRHQANYICKTFGIPDIGPMQQTLDDYYRLAWSRKPEFMGWEREWDLPQLERLSDTQYSFENYNDAQQRLADYQSLALRAYAMMKELPDSLQPAFFEMVAYPAMASCQMNRKFLMAQLNHELYAKADSAGARWAASESKKAFDEINALNDAYNTMLSGKWRGMMDLAPGWCAKYQLMPELNGSASSHWMGSQAAKVDPQKNQLQGCAVLDLRAYEKNATNATFEIIEGIGYDWKSLRMGDPVAAPCDPQSASSPRAVYKFAVDEAADSVKVIVYALPLWPLNNERSTRLGVSVDGSQPIAFENVPQEYSPEWKTQVLQNSVVYRAQFPLDANMAEHTLSLICGDPGEIVQRVVIDWGGLKPSYVGPSARY